MTEHRVSLLGERWRRFEDPVHSRDPQIRALVGQLSTLAPAPGPAADFRAELRAQLVAIAPRIVAEGIAEHTSMVDILPAKGAERSVASEPERAARRFRPARVLAVSGAMVVAFALLLGGAVVLSQKAIPGDTLYGLKRASEQFELATDGSDAERANDLLRFAGRRADEVQQLIGRANATAAGPGAHAGGFSSSTTALIVSTLQAANSDTAQASRLLATQAIHDGSAAPLTNMTNWAPQQLGRLKEIWSSLPVGSARTATTGSVDLVTSAQTRAKELIGSVDCACAATAATDLLGPKPCQVCPSTATTPARPTAPHPAATRVKHSSAPVGRPSPIHPVPSHPVPSPAIPALPSVSTPAPTTGVAPVPILSSLLPSKPVTVTTCGISINLLGIKVKLGACPSGH